MATTTTRVRSARPPAPRTTPHRRRMLGALLAGLTMSASLAVAGAFGLTGRASAATTLSGTTYIDVNNDGQITVDADLQRNDKRIAGVNVAVFDSSGARVATAVTDANGNWQVVVDQAGPFRVEFNSTPQFVFPGFQNGGGDVQFTSGGVVNFGLYGKLDGLGNIAAITDPKEVQIGNRVWLDTNADGIQDAGEVGINGVTVELSNPNGTPALDRNGAPMTSTTYGDGIYTFAGLPGLTPYLVQIKDTPANHAILSSYGLTLKSVRTGFGNDQNDSDAVLVGSTAQISATTPLAGANLDFDFGYVVSTPPTTTTTLPPTTTAPPTTEPPTTQPTTTTTPPTTAPPTTAPPTTAPPTTAPPTTAPPTTAPPTTAPPTTAPPTTAPPTTAPPTTAPPTTAPPTTAPPTTQPPTTTTPPTTQPPTTAPTTTTPTTTVPPTYCLGDLLFDDLNGDGIRTGNEPGVPAQMVYAFNAPGTLVGQSPTDAAGNYKICGLRPGAYSVGFTKPSNSSFTKQLSGNDRNNANSSGVAPAVTIVDADILSVDAGIVRSVAPSTYCIGDFVWLDTNGNGLQDAGEPGVAGVQVDVLNASGAVIGTALTDGNGGYKVCGLAPGNYSVRFTQPSGMLFTVPLAGTDRNVDSDASNTGFTGTVTIVNADVLTVDAGLIRTVPVVVTTTTPTTTTPAPTTAAPTTAAPLVTACLGDKVFIDPTGTATDGKGIPGVSLTLVKPDGATVTALTDADGIYTFCSLTGGRYTVKVNPATLPAGARPSYDLNGTKNNETTIVLPPGQSSKDVDFGYTLPQPIVTVEPQVIERPAVDVPAFTGVSNTTTKVLWGISLMLIGFGLIGLTADRRRRN